MCKQLERICWGLPASGFNYSFLFQMISEKHGTKNILLTIWETFLYKNSCNYNCYKFIYKIFIQFPFFCGYQIQKFYYMFFLLMLLFSHTIMLVGRCPPKIFFFLSAFIVGTWKGSDFFIPVSKVKTLHGTPMDLPDLPQSSHTLKNQRQQKELKYTSFER